MAEDALAPELEMMVTSARRLVRDLIIAPRLDMALDRSGDFPHAPYRTLWENGMVNLEFPEAVGGPALGSHDHAVVQEELHYGCLGISTSVVANNLAAMPIILAGKPELAKKYLGMLVEEPRYAAYGCSEPDAGSDVAALTTKFVRRGDTYILNGQKRWITNGDVADWYTVFAREEGTQAHRGIACFVVDARAKGARWDALVHKLGQRASHTCDLVFEDVEVPAANLLAGPDHGFKLAMATFDRTRPWIAAAAAGVIRRARDESLRYAMERKTFGTAIVNHQMVQAMLADMEIAYRATRLLCLDAARQIDAGNPRGVHSACAKAYGADAAMRVTTDAVQIFGGYGYTNEFVVEKLMRDAKLLQIYEGTSQIQRMVICRDMVRALTA